MASGERGERGESGMLEIDLPSLLLTELNGLGD